MMKKSKTIIFFGTDEFSLTSLVAIYKAGYRILAVVTKPDRKKGRGQKTIPSAVKSFALEHNVPVWQPEKITDINQTIKNLAESPLGVLVSFGKIIPESTIKLFSPGIMNIHPSLLPKYRGATPIESAIRNGDLKTGVSIIKLTPLMDAGDIYAQETIQLKGSEDSISLYSQLANVGANLMVKTLPKIIDETINPIIQSEAKVTYCETMEKAQAWINLDELTAVEAERVIRANLIFPKTKLKINNQEIIVTKAHPVSSPKTILDLKCKQNSYLSIDELIIPGSCSMSAAAFLNGHRI